jgi:hypothetical protein
MLALKHASSEQGHLHSRCQDHLMKREHITGWFICRLFVDHLWIICSQANLRHRTENHSSYLWGLEISREVEGTTSFPASQ